MPTIWYITKPKICPQEVKCQETWDQAARVGNLINAANSKEMQVKTTRITRTTKYPGQAQALVGALLILEVLQIHKEEQCKV